MYIAALLLHVLNCIGSSIPGSCSKQKSSARHSNRASGICGTEIELDRNYLVLISLTSTGS